MSKTIVNHIFEIRIKPDARFLDKRGSVADQMTNAKFNHWNISGNRIDFTSSDHPELTAFFSFRNLGVASRVPSTTDEFRETAEEFIKSAWQHFATSTIIRIGVRSIFLTQASDFKKSFDAYRGKFLKLSDDDLSKFGGDLVDLGFPLNFIEGDNFFNINTGPMEDKQSKDIFGDKAFKAGVFLDVDYFRKEISPHIIQKHVVSFVEDGIKKANTVMQQITQLVFGK